jgi:hypothetical protein
LTNTEIARLLTETAEAQLGPSAADETPSPTVALTATATVPTTPTVSPTATEVVVLTTSTATTVGPETATALALAAAQQQAATATSTPTALPGTGGFAEDIGIPGMLLLAAVLVAVIFVARHLRTRSS